MSTIPTPSKYECGPAQASLGKRLFAMGLVWAVMGGMFGYYALEYGNIASAVQIIWFALASAALGVVAVLVSRLLPRRFDPGSMSLLMGGAMTGAVALSSLAACTVGGGWIGTIVFSALALVCGAVLGFGVSVFSLVVEQNGLWKVVRDLGLESSGCYDRAMTNAVREMPFGEVLEAVERLSPKEQEDLVTLLQNRITERGRARLAREVYEARQEFDLNGCRKSSTDDLMGEILS
jgi:hypothetical protein